jgi:hypothetical protein
MSDKTITMRLRADTGDMSAGLQRGGQEFRAFAAEIKQASADVRTYQKELTVGGGSMSLLDYQDAQQRLAFAQEKKAALQQNQVMAQLEERRFAATHSQREIDLRNLEQNYQRQREMFLDNEEALTKIDETYTAERAKLAEESAERTSAGGIKGVGHMLHAALRVGVFLEAAEIGFGIAEAAIDAFQGKWEKMGEAIEQIPILGRAYKFGEKIGDALFDGQKDAQEKRLKQDSEDLKFYTKARLDSAEQQAKVKADTARITGEDQTPAYILAKAREERDREKAANAKAANVKTATYGGHFKLQDIQRENDARSDAKYAALETKIVGQLMAAASQKAAEEHIAPAEKGYKEAMARAQETGRHENELHAEQARAEEKGRAEAMKRAEEQGREINKQERARLELEAGQAAGIAAAERVGKGGGEARKVEEHAEALSAFARGGQFNDAGAHWRETQSAIQSKPDDPAVGTLNELKKLNRDGIKLHG